jgi:hypothetical protein
LVAKLIASALERPEADVAMRNVHAWVGLRDLVGGALRVEDILSNIGALNRDETLFTLARIAGDLANAPGGVLGPEARAWTRDLLVKGRDFPHPLQRAIAEAVERLPLDRTIAHAHVVFALQVLAAVRGSVSAPAPHDNYLAFMMLAVNDYIPEWRTSAQTEMTSTERSLASMFLTSAFNRSDDSLRFLLRTIDIMGSQPKRGTFTVEQWAKIQEEAFGVPFPEYAEAFLAPMLLMSKGWGFKTTPIVFPEEWVTGDRAKLYERWLDEASLPVEAAVQSFAERPLPSGLFALSAAFFRTPFLKIDGRLVGLSPWHVRDHATLGTWAKLNAASKKVLNTTSNQSFSSAFGYFVESWCARIAREAADAVSTSEALLLPTSPGAADEIEDLVFQDGDLVVLMSVKASLVPEPSLKAADASDAPVQWLRKFFFEDVAEAKGKGYRGGAVHLLNKKVQQLRAGAFERQGISKNATVLPAIVCFDNVGESGILYKWLEEECRRRALFGGDVRPLTVITPEDFESLMALRARGQSVCRLLFEKTQPRQRWGPLDQFLFGRVQDSRELRLPSMEARFHALVQRSLQRIPRRGTSDGED